MKIDNVEVMGIESSMIASGYPMRTKEIHHTFNEDDVKRCVRLSRLGGAHEQYLTGMTVNFDLTCSNKMWIEAERYRFLFFISSQSTMHRISKMDIGQQCNSYVDDRIINIINDLKEEYINSPTPEKYLTLLYNIPSGFELTARMSTNYRCLKNIHNQRKNHRLPEWREFCYWVETLPYFRQLLKSKNQ